MLLSIFLFVGVTVTYLTIQCYKVIKEIDDNETFED